MTPNLATQTLYGFLRDDFRTAWDAMARDPYRDAGGNFLFLRQVLAMLEIACRVCEASGVRLDALATELAREDKRYFATLPTSVRTPSGYRLPSVPGSPPDRQLLALIFDLGRNGLAHQGQQILAKLNDGKRFGLSVEGVGTKTVDSAYPQGPRPARHLDHHEDPSGDVWLRIRPEIMFIDLDRAVRRSHVLSGGHDLAYFKRTLETSSGALTESLRKAGSRSLPGPD